MLALLRTVIQARLQRQQQVNLSLLEAVYNTLWNITLGCSLGAHTLKQVGFPAIKSELLPARLLLWENSKVRAGQRLAALHRLCSCLSIMLQSNARKSWACLVSFFFLSWRWSEGPSRLYCNQLISAGEASGFALAGLKGSWQTSWSARGL